MAQELTDFTLPTDAYATFDAVSLKRLLIDRLNQTSFFTDQNFAASNISSLIDTFSFAYHVLLYFLNQTATEAIFTEAQLYENMNRIVKALDYNPIGAQTSNLTFNVTNTDGTLTVNTYTIPRYSFINANGKSFSLRDDVTFTQSTTGVQSLLDLSSNNLMYQGIFTEYPILIATGEAFETVTLLPGDDVTIDHFGIHVYIKPLATGVWEQWDRTSSLYLESAGAKKFEVRLNENKHYEIKFGNGIIAQNLQAGDSVAIYYLKSDAKSGEVGIGTIDSKPLVLFSTPQFLQIFTDIRDSNTAYVTDTQATALLFTNSNVSSQFYAGETVDDIRERAPKIFTAQYRLITAVDYRNYLLQNFANIVKDVQVVNNWTYMDGHLKYLLDTLKLSTANKNPNAHFNNILFADTCDFNNVYIYAVPQQEITNSATIRNNYLTPAQKSSIIVSMKDNKTMTTETLIVDPIYVAVDFGIVGASEILSTDAKDNTQLVITRSRDSKKNPTLIKNSVFNILVNYFKASTLGQTVDITSLVNSILGVDGVKAIHTQRTDNTDFSTVGLNLLIWNPIYPDLDIISTSSNVVLPYFKFPYLFDAVNLINKIVVVTETSTENTAQ